MVAKSADFVPFMLTAEHSLAANGTTSTDVMGGDRSAYNTHLLTLSLIAMVMKAIQDISPLVATDANWQTRLNSAIDMTGGWPGWILLQISPENLALYGGTTADSLATLQAKINAYNTAQGQGFRAGT